MALLIGMEWIYSPCLKSKVPNVGNDPMEIINMSKQHSTGESWLFHNLRMYFLEAFYLIDIS